jgi:hypothetical protein
MTGKTSSDARRRGLLAAVSVLGVSLGMASAHADTPQDTIKGGAPTQGSDQLKGETSQFKHDSSQLKGESSQLKGQSSNKTDSALYKQGSSQLKGESDQQKGSTQQKGWAP